MDTQTAALTASHEALLVEAWGAEGRYTLSEELSFTGLGAHSGLACRATLSPLHRPAGLILNGLPLRAWRREARWATRLIHPQTGAQVYTPEHLLAALYGAGVDDLSITVEVSSGEGPSGLVELPMLDGSAWPWLRAMRPTPTGDGRSSRAWRPLPSCTIERPSASLTCSPKALAGAEGRLTMRLSLGLSELFSEPRWAQLPRQEALMLGARHFCKLIAPARTFGLRSHEAALRARGLIQGVTEDSCLILDHEGRPHRSLLHPDELAAHKLLDALGDLSLSGVRWAGHIEVKEGSHALNHALLHLLEGADMIANSKDPV